MSRQPHHDLQLLLGAYVLGGLDAHDRRRIEEHLPRCQQCTTELSRFAAVPGLLQLAPPSEPPATPEDSLPRLIAAARTRRATRQRRRWLLAAAAVVLALTGVTGGVVLAGRDTGPAPTAVVMSTPAGESRTVGEAVLDPRSWGTEVRLELNYVPRGEQPYSAWAVDKNGREEQAASWMTPPGGRCSVTGATSIRREELDRVEIRSADGRTLLRTR